MVIFAFNFVYSQTIISVDSNNNQLKIGEVYTIKWPKENFSDNNRINISFSKIDATGNEIATIGLLPNSPGNKGDIANTGSYAVLIPQNVEPGNYKFVINCDFLQSSKCFYNSIKSSVFSVVTKLESTQNNILKPTANYNIGSNLKIGSRNNDVVNLQIGLKNLGFYNGPITGYFGLLTKLAVIKFQEKYSDDILKPNGLKGGNGFVGYATKKKFNSLLNINSDQSIKVDLSLTQNLTPQEVRAKAIQFLKDNTYSDIYQDNRI